MEIATVIVPNIKFSSHFADIVQKPETELQLDSASALTQCVKFSGENI
jgi:hypothetical protein